MSISTTAFTNIPTLNIYQLSGPPECPEPKHYGERNHKLYSWCLALCLAPSRGWINTCLMNAGGMLYFVASSTCSLGLQMPQLLTVPRNVPSPLLQALPTSTRSQQQDLHSWGLGHEALETMLTGARPGPQKTLWVPSEKPKAKYTSSTQCVSLTQSRCSCIAQLAISEPPKLKPIRHYDFRSRNLFSPRKSPADL